MAKDPEDSKADELERKLKAEQERVRKAEAMLKKGDYAGIAKEQLGDILDAKQQKILEQAQEIASKGEIDSKSMAGMASMLGSQMGLSEEHQKLIEALGGGDDFDIEQAANIPGLVVDKDTNKASILGLIELDATNPTTRLIAGAVNSLYSGAALPVNEAAFGKLYKFVSKNAAKAPQLRAYSHPLAYGTAASAVAAVSFWPDVNKFIQQEKQGRKSMQSVADRFALVLDDYVPSSASRVGKLYQLTPQANQMIVNERARVAANQNAERFRNAIDTIGRLPLLTVSLMRGHESIAQLSEQTKAASELSKKQLPEETPEKLRLRLMKEKTDQYQKELGLERKDAAKMAQEEVQLQQKDAEVNSTHQGLMGKITDSGVMIAPFLVSSIANNLFEKRLKDRGIQPVSASDMVEELGKQLDDNAQSERFALPKGVSELGSKTGNNQLKLEDYIEQIFRQHQRDTHGNEATIPSRFDEPLKEACKQIAEVLRADKMDGRAALIKLVGEQKIVGPSGRKIADKTTIESILKQLEDDLFLVESIDAKEEMADRGLTTEEIRTSWKHMDKEERAFIAMAESAQVLECAGINPQEIRQLRAQHKDEFAKQLTNVVQNLEQLGDEVLSKQGATSSDIKTLHSFANKIGKHPNSAEKLPEVASRSEIAGVRQVVASLVLGQSAEHDGLIASEAMKNR